MSSDDYRLFGVVSSAFIVQGDTKKTGTFENPTKLKHLYGESTLLSVPLIHDY